MQVNLNEVKRKRRGSRSGLIVYQRRRREANTQALHAAVTQLALTQGDKLWSYAEVARAAALRSGNAIREHWNSDIKARIDEHNTTWKTIQAGQGRTSGRSSAAKCDQLGSQILGLRADLKRALSQVARFEAEADWYKQENMDLKATCARLEKQLNAGNQSEAGANNDGRARKASPPKF